MSRWTVLTILFFVRTGMGFQYQTPAALGTLLQSHYSVALDQIGLLIGIYFVTGMGLAIPAAALGSLVNEKRAVSIGLALMAVGGLCAGLSQGWGGLAAARVIAGTGGVLINILMTKIVADWFADGAIATAMAIFVNSWPVGIAVALVAAPAIGLNFGPAAVFYAGAAWALAGLVLIQFLPAPPEKQASARPAEWQSSRNSVRVVLAGLVWAFFNAAFVVVFSFGPTMLQEDGLSLVAAGGAISLILWFSIVGVFAGGVLADKSGRPGLIIVACSVLMIVAIAVVAKVSSSYVMFAVLGMLTGLPAGSIMALPARILPVPERARGMAYFYTVFYAVIVLSPIIAGLLSAHAGSARVAFLASAGLMAAGLACFALLKLVERRWLARSTAAA